MKTKITIKRALELQCHECMGHYSDGKVDCECTSCSLYKWMPYRKLEPNYSRFDYSPRRTGKVLLEDCAVILTDEQRQAASDRLKAARERKIITISHAKELFIDAFGESIEGNNE